MVSGDLAGDVLTMLSSGHLGRSNLPLPSLCSRRFSSDPCFPCYTTIRCLADRSFGACAFDSHACNLVTDSLPVYLPLQAFSVNSENHTVKIGSEETLSDAYDQHMRQPEYEPLGSTKFNDLLEDVTELVHNHSSSSRTRSR